MVEGRTSRTVVVVVVAPAAGTVEVAVWNEVVTVMRVIDLVHMTLVGNCVLTATSRLSFAFGVISGGQVESVVVTVLVEPGAV